MLFNYKSKKDIVLEAEAIDVDTGSETDDYTEDEETGPAEATDQLDDEDAEEESPDDYTEGEGEIDLSEEADDNTEDEGSDYTEDEGTETDSEYEEEPTEGEEDNSPSNLKHLKLLEDTIRLRDIIINTKKRLSEYRTDNSGESAIINKVLTNISLLDKHLYNYIIHKFNSAEYTKNLYFYSSCVEAFNVSVKMVEKIKRKDR